MTNPNAVAKRDPQQPQTLDLNSAKAATKFLDAYAGRLDKMSAEQQSMFLMALGQRLGVRAELGELILYQSKPYITLAGRIRLAHETGLLVGMEVRPATALECRNYGCEQGDVLWVCNVFRRGAGRAFTGWGHVSTKDRNPVTKTHPREMAKKRARYDGLHIAFPPAEQITPLHQKYIEEAEAEIQNGVMQNYPLLSTQLNAEDAAEDTEGETAAADAEQPAAPTGELPFDQPTTKGKSTNALAQP